MTVKVKLHTTLKKFAPADSGGKVEMDVPEGATAQSLIERLEIPENFVGAVFVAGQRSELDLLLTEGMEVDIIAPMGGG